MFSSTKFVTLLALLCLASATTTSQTTWEFSGTSYAFQKVHFDSATSVVRTKLGIQMRTFGAPYNQIDTNLIRVMREDTCYKVLLLGQIDPHPMSGQVNLKNRVMIESATGVPDYNYFLSSWYSKKALYTDYMVMQGHPYAWTTTAKLTEFQNIVNFLIATDSVVFNTPYGYYRYITDLSIPRTNKIQVILKLDDLRATSSYFFPCLPTYDFLAANNVKAAFGVNKMEALTQAQIDTLHHYTSLTNGSGDPLFEIWNHGLDHSMTASSVGGNWSSPDSWPEGYVPTSVDDAIVPAGVTITVDDTNAVCNNLTVNGTLVMSNTAQAGLVVHGDVLINSGGSFTSPSLTGGTGNITHNLTVYGDFTNAGGTFDFRMGSSGTTMRMMNTTFLGSYNSTITVGVYSSGNNDFNGITINKSGGAKIICGSDVVCDPGASTGKSQLVLTNGIIETGNFTFYVLSTTSADIVTPSATSYVSGALGRGMSNSAGKTNSFPIGDASAYRPLTLRSTTAGTATGHHVIVRCVGGNANTGSSILNGGINAVSAKRYYQISYNKGIGSGATSMDFDQFYPSYGADDGVVSGNTDLRVAYSTDSRSTWTGLGQTTNPHTTDLTNPPTQIKPDNLSPVVTLVSGSNSILISLANATGGVNPLPIQLASFTGRVLSPGIVSLEWMTTSEVNNYGFYVERRMAGESIWSEVPGSFVAGHGTTAQPHEYTFVDNSASNNRMRYRLKQVDLDGSIHFTEPIEVGGITSVESTAPVLFGLSQNYPNPFNPSTSIRYSIANASKVSITVYNVLGQLVETLVDAEMTAGSYTIVWNARSNSELPSGVYFCRLVTPVFSKTRSMILLR